MEYERLFRLAFSETGALAEILQSALEDGFFVVEHTESGRLVASCVALRGSHDSRHPDGGWLGWLVTDPAHTGKGLGTIVAASVTNRLALEGYPRPYLVTEDFRLAAISIFLTLGWRPHVYRDGMVARWRVIFSLLGKEFEMVGGRTDRT